MLYTRQHFAKQRALEEASALRRAKAKAYSAKLRKERRQVSGSSRSSPQQQSGKKTRVTKVDKDQATTVQNLRQEVQELKTQLRVHELYFQSIFGSAASLEASPSQTTPEELVFNVFV